MRRWSASLLVLAIPCLACGSGDAGTPDAGGSSDALSDVPTDLPPGDDGSPADLPDDPAPDLGGETGPDATGDAAPDTLDPAAVFELRTHAGCRPDGPYRIDRVTQFRDGTTLADVDVRAVAVAEGATWLGTPTGVFVAGALDLAFRALDLPGAPAVVADLAPAPDGGMFVARGSMILVADLGGTFALLASGAGDVGRVVPCAGDVYALSGGALFRAVGGRLDPVEGPEAGGVTALACAAGVLWAGNATGLWRRDGTAWTRTWVPDGGAPVSVLAAGGARVAAGAGDQVAVVSEGLPPEVRAPGAGGLPTGDVRALALSADGAVLVVGHAIGATRVDRGTGAIEHFHSLRWLPAETVTAVALDPATSSAWVGTPGGAARLDKVGTSLTDKAGRMADQLDRWFWRLGGFVSANAVFPDPWTEAPVTLHDDDNDGQWTQEAVGSFCYAWQVTGDERYYQAARKAITNMAMQIDLPAQDFIAAGLGRGFVTRSFVRDDEGEVFTSKAGQSNWHLVHYADGHDYYWKDDTSSDEVDGHFYGFSIYYDLCARDDEERAFVADHLVALAGYILDHGFTLPDLDAQPTTHGNWSPARLAVAVDGLEACVDGGTPLEACIDAWGGGAFLDSVEILGGMLAAWHVSGQQRFLDAYESLVTDHRYGELATFNPDVATWTLPGTANYCDHELADLAFLTLLRYEPHPDRRQRWIDSMLAAWQHEVGERNPLKSLALSAVLADPPGLAAGVGTLVEYPEDLRQVLVDNGHRQDYVRNGTDRFGEPQFRDVPPYDEIAVVRWDSNPYRVVGGGSPQVRRAPNFWLLPYWGLRYYGAICP